jgi:hypothetical protein
MYRLLSLVCVLFAAALPNAEAMGFGPWTVCITVPNSYCQLDPGTYTLNVLSGNKVNTLNIANGVTATGSGTSNYSTVIQRPSNATGNLFYVSQYADVAINYLTIDGNRFSVPNAQSGCPDSPNGVCGPPGGYGCPSFDNNNFVDIWIDGAASIDEVAIWHSAGTTPLYMNGTVMWSAFYYGRSAGPWGMPVRP